jgi:C-terminal processing protease CtpA/Prc
VLFIKDVNPGSAADSAGIRPWDSIEQVGTQRIADVFRFDDMDQIILNQRSEGRIHLKIGHWKPSPSDERKHLLELRDMVLAVPGS